MLTPTITSLLIFLIAHLLVTVSVADTYSRDDFPPGFVFGSGSSAYQVEGAANQDGRTPSIWDTFTHAGKVHGANGDIACDEYHKYKEDVRLMVDTGLEAYRFSISWSRLIPNGRGQVNPKGLQYYNNLINELISHGIQPHVTLLHYDVPQTLEDEYEGLLSRKIVKDFTEYANVCFKEFGDRVLHWTTVNEPNVFVLGSYDLGLFPPARCSSPFGAFGFNCSRGNSSSEPYMAAHNILLAHASVARLYKNKYRDKQHGFVGLNIFTYWFIPLTNKTEDKLAAQRAKDFHIGWFLDPLMYGDYPTSMKKNAGLRIPAFTNHESKQVKGAFDFLAVNYYATVFVKDNNSSLKMENRDFNADMGVEIMYSHINTSAFEFPVTPWGLQEVLGYFKQVYGNPPIYIHENGKRTPRNSSLEDWPRVKYLNECIGGLHDAIMNGSNARGYFTWSFLDAFELLDGYDSSYGLYYVDRDDPELRRQPKLSALWYSHFLKRGDITSNGVIELEKYQSTHSNANLFKY
ncbi:Glyco_hydro_1 domain-containing protein [Cephalotus follicularis]|uniref:Glyco_hydro_1 domain-containing protein n=1 Tax=Cephalotus follicularis TaxID=3775 RepID=A0A1Q3CID9_CEPFO|nr:Glyco_hydro_1 domain-containing protein [Cephalotus follicularis]